MKMHSGIDLCGFSLLEILIVILIIGMLSSIALPRVSEVMHHMNDLMAKNEIENAINYAREYALIHGEAVSVCGVMDGTCSMDWSKNIIIFKDPTRQGHVNNKNIISRIELATQSHIIWKSSLHKLFLTWLPRGFTNAQISSLTLSNADEIVWQLTINQLGFIREKKNPSQRGFFKVCNN